MWLPFPWRQGEHMSIIGSTGSGKTVLASNLVTVRGYNLYVKTKADDVKLPGWTRTNDPRAIRRPTEDRIFLDLAGDPRAVKAQKIRWLFKELGGDGKKPIGWTVTVDELFYWIDQLRLGEVVEEAQTQWRSRFGTIVNNMQRPVRVSRFAISESSHVLTFGIEPRDAKTLGEATTEQLGEIAARGLNWERHEFAWWARKLRRIWIGRYNITTGALEVSRQAA